MYILNTHTHAHTYNAYMKLMTNVKLDLMFEVFGFLQKFSIENTYLNHLMFKRQHIFFYKKIINTKGKIKDKHTDL